MDEKHKEVLHAQNYITPLDCNCQIPLQKILVVWDLEAIEVLLERIEIVNSKGGRKETSLHKTSHHGAAEVAERMELILRDGDGKELLYSFMCNRDDLELVDDLVSPEDACVNSRDSNYQVPLHCASREGAVKMVERLIEGGACVNVQDLLGRTPAHYAFNKGNICVLKILLAHNANMKLRDKKGKTLLHSVCMVSDNSNLEVVDLLLKANACVNSQDPNGRTPLHFASWRGAEKVVERLIEGGAQVNAQDYRGKVPAHYACHKGNICVLKILLQHGADFNKQDNFSLTPLITACRKLDDRYLEVIDFLIGCSNVNTKSNLGETALHTVIKKAYKMPLPCRNIEICKKLLDSGAQVDAKNKIRKTPYDFIGFFRDRLRFARYINLMTLFNKHIIKLKTAGLAVDISLKTNSDERKGFKSECVEELNKMQVTKVNDEHYLNILFVKSMNPWFLRNADTLKQLEKQLNSVDFVQDFPLYGKILRNSFETAKQRFHLLEAAFVSFNSDKRKPILSWKLPDVVKYKLLNYLNNSDLKSLIESG